MKKVFVYTSILILLDQLVKLIISNKVILNNSINIIPDFFSITNVKNIGAAFSILSGNRIFLIIVAFVALYLIYNYFIKDKELKNIEVITYCLLISGIIGNLIDRIIFGYVVDYFEFVIFNYNFPIFNLADIFIMIGCFLLIIVTIKEEIKCKNI